MPHFNYVLEEYGIHHEEYEVPIEVLACIEKKRDAATRNVTVMAEPKKRKGGGAAKALAKKPRVGVLAEVSASSSSSGGSSSASSRLAEPAEGLIASAHVIEAPTMKVCAPIGPQPSAVNLLPSLLGEDSSNAEAPVGKPAAIEAATFDLEDSGEVESAPRHPPMVEAAPSTEVSASPLGLCIGPCCCFCFPFLFGLFMLVSSQTREFFVR